MKAKKISVESFLINEEGDNFKEFCTITADVSFTLSGKQWENVIKNAQNAKMGLGTYLSITLGIQLQKEYRFDLDLSDLEKSMLTKKG